MWPIRRILVPVDFSECSRKALEYALGLASVVGARVDVLHAWTLPAGLSSLGSGRVIATASGETLEELAQKEATRQMNELVAGVARKGELELGIYVEIGPEADVIVQAARNYDLVVMGTHGRTGVPLLVLGSVAERVVRRAPCPVLTVRGPASTS